MRLLIALILCIPTLTLAEVLPNDLNASQKSAVNAEISVTFDVLDTAQAIWLAGDPRRRFIQIISRPTISNGKASRMVDRVATKPRHRSEGLTELGIPASSTSICDYVIDDYRGNLGKGFLVHCELEFASVVWRRTRHVGPEDLNFTDSSTGWYQMTED